MLFEFEWREQNTTEVTLKISADPDTCEFLSDTLSKLADALSQAKRRFVEHKRWIEDIPRRQTLRDQLKEAITRKINHLKNLPYRETVKIIAHEFTMTWDSADFWIREIRWELKAKHQEKRENLILQMKNQGMSVAQIADKVKLAKGTVYNIIHQMKLPINPSPNTLHAPTTGD